MKLDRLFRKVSKALSPKPPKPDHPLVRSASDRLAKRTPFLKQLDRSLKFLEIGAYFTPVLQGPNVRYLDVFDTDELKARAKMDPDPKITPEAVVDVHYSNSDGDMSIVDEKFQAAFISHCIEHQPDLIRHLKQVHDLLESGGRYYFLAPDKRYCFDHFRPESTLGEVLQAAREKRNRNSYKSVIDSAAMVTHNRATDHWLGNHIDQGQSKSPAQRARAAQAEIESAGDGYIDAHAWQFTPLSFALIVEALFEMGHSPLRPLFICDTPVFHHEFTAVLEKQA